MVVLTGTLSTTCPEYDLLQERLDTSVFPLLLILLHDDDASVAAACLRSMALAAAALPPPPPASADGKNSARDAASAGEENEAAPLNAAEVAARSLAKLKVKDDKDGHKDGTDDGVSNEKVELRPMIGMSARGKARRRLPLLSVRHVGKLLPTVEDLATHRDWRLREWAIAVIPVLHTALQRTTAPAAKPKDEAAAAAMSSSPGRGSPEVLRACVVRRFTRWMRCHFSVLAYFLFLSRVFAQVLKARGGSSGGSTDLADNESWAAAAM
jgi:hypothetical protein